MSSLKLEFGITTCYSVGVDVETASTLFPRMTILECRNGRAQTGEHTDRHRLETYRERLDVVIERSNIIQRKIYTKILIDLD